MFFCRATLLIRRCPGFKPNCLDLNGTRPAFEGFRPRRQRDRFAHRWEHCSKARDFFEWLSARRKIWPGHYKPEVVDWSNDRHAKLARAAAWAEPLTQKWRTCECLSGGREFKPSQPFVAGSGGVDWRVLEAPTVFHRSHCFRTASRYFRSRGHLGGQPPGRFRAQLGDGTVGVITSATVPPKNRRSASKRNMPPFLFAQPVFRWPPEPSKWCPEGASSSAAEPVGRPVQLVARGSVRHEQQNGRQPALRASPGGERNLPVPRTPPRPPARSISGCQPVVPPWRSSTEPAAVAPAAEAAEAAVAAPEPAAFPPVPTGKARPLRPKQPSCPPPPSALHQAEATASSAAVVAPTRPRQPSCQPPPLKLRKAEATASSAAVVAPTEPAAVARSSANKLSVGRTHRPSTEGSCGLELALRRLMNNTLLTKSKRERCRETI